MFIRHVKTPDCMLFRGKTIKNEIFRFFEKVFTFISDHNHPAAGLTRLRPYANSRGSFT